MGGGTGNRESGIDKTPFPGFPDTRPVTEDEVTLVQERLWILLDRDDAQSPDFRQAAAWFQKAANQGNARARATPGEISEFGDGVPRDMAAAIGWYRWSHGRATSRLRSSLATACRRTRRALLPPKGQEAVLQDGETGKRRSAVPSAHHVR
ncbi:MAG: hypothetical protein OXI66_04000 [Boseongicola sp.]|nr:hypothetical protein [Boseongicola sp.]MDE0344935.1 hypothetical protein [Boseongicola sp.]